MGQIVIKVPNDIEEEFVLRNEKDLEKLIFLLKRLKDFNEALDFILNNRGILPKNFHISEEELHLQEK